MEEGRPDECMTKAIPYGNIAIGIWMPQAEEHIEGFTYRLEAHERIENTN